MILMELIRFLANDDNMRRRRWLAGLDMFTAMKWTNSDAQIERLKM